ATEQKVDAFLERLADVSDDAFDAVILSGEAFLSLDPDAVMALVPDHLWREAEVEIVAYIRHPVDTYLSSQQQVLKLAPRYASPFAPRRKEIPELLERWRQTIPHATFHVRPFARHRLVRESVTSDFASVLNKALPGRKLQLPEVRTNESLTAEQLIVCQRLNCALSGPAIFTPERKFVLKLFDRLNLHGGLGTPLKLHPRARKILAALYRDEIERLNAYAPRLKFKAAKHPIPDVRLHKLKRRIAWEEVTDIIDAYDPDLVSQFAAMIPALNPTLETGLDANTARALDDICALSPEQAARLRRAMAIYWQRVAPAAYEALEATVE
ncbi:MAG: hypothetical protein AAGP08_15030, partial [Pseudomonadota bacterium]